MAPKSKSQATEKSGKNSSFVRIDRIGKVSIYRHGASYWLYYRENRRNIRFRIDGNLATARSTASQINSALEEKRPSPFHFEHIDIRRFIGEYLNSCKDIRGLSGNTIRRYRAALSHFEEFAHARGITSPGRVTETTVEDFVKYMRSKTRVRSGARHGKKAAYRTKGIKFILSTCRSAFNYARKRRYLPPYSENPFSSFSIEKMKERDSDKTIMLTQSQLQELFERCDQWQFPIFFFLALYGLRVGELTHLLISDLDFEQEAFSIQSKPEMLWFVKTQMQRLLPIVPEVKPMLKQFVGPRKAGFVFVNREQFEGRASFEMTFQSPHQFRAHLKRMLSEAREEGIEDEIELKKKLTPFLRRMGQIPEKRIRGELMKLTKEMGCPEITKTHSLRHLFSTSAQENGMNPLIVQGILGHTSLEMTGLYTHIGIDEKRKAVSEFLSRNAALSSILQRKNGRSI